MKRWAEAAAYSGPAVLVFASLLTILTNRHAWWGPVLVLVAGVTAPLWPFVILRLDAQDADRSQLLTAFDFQMTMVVGYALGLILMLVFVGLLVFFVVIVAQCALGAEAAWSAWRGRPIGKPRVALLHFSERFGLA
jgi:O-antigen/teichoic acid export membrane protein